MKRVDESAAEIGKRLRLYVRQQVIFWKKIQKGEEVDGNIVRSCIEGAGFARDDIRELVRKSELVFDKPWDWS